MDESVEPDYGHETTYSDATIKSLISLYIGAIVVWTVFYYSIGAFHKKQLFYKLAYFIPLILFGISLYFLTTGDLTNKSEKMMYKTNFLSIGLVIFFPIFSTIVTKYRGDRQFFITLMISGFIFSLLSLYDVWVSPDYQPILKHLKTILQTFTITLIIIAMYTFHLNETDPETIKKNTRIPLL